MTAKDLAAEVVARKAELGLSQPKIRRRGGPCTETLRLIEGAHHDRYRSSLLLKLDNALDWPGGWSEMLLLDGQAHCNTCTCPGRGAKS